MCHGKNGNGQGETAKDMKLTMVGFADPATLKERTDGEIFYVIKKRATRICPQKVSASRPKRTGTWSTTSARLRRRNPTPSKRLNRKKNRSCNEGTNEMC
jgi:hypothetical protein